MAVLAFNFYVSTQMGDAAESILQLFLTIAAVGVVTDAQLAEIAEIKKVDLNAHDVEAAKKIIAGTARSMGLEVEG